LEASQPEELKAAFASAADQHADAIVVLGDLIVFQGLRLSRWPRNFICPRSICFASLLLVD
jgi:hypothetical protein